MLHEKPDEFFPLKNKLEDLEQLPEDASFDKSGAWQKLQNRLDKQPVIKIRIWHWIAAACVLLFAGATWFNRDAVNNNKAALLPKQKSENALVVKPLITDTPSHVKPQVTGEKKQHFTAHVRNTPVSPRTPLHVQPETPSLSQIEVPVLSRQDDLPSINPDTARTEPLIVVKKKLRVVHINELDEPTPVRGHFALNMTPPAFRQTRHYQDVFPGIEFSKNASDNLLKIKLPPSN